jgi:hypothetical protein
MLISVLQKQVNKRFAQDFQLLVAYTLGKVLDDNPTLGTINPGPGDNTLLSDARQPRRDRGPGDFDQRHRLVASGVWELNYGKGLPRLARAVVSGWQLSGILAVDSGQPYSAMVNFDLNSDGNSATDRTPGVGRNSFYLPTTVSLDPRLTRKVQLHEGLRLQISWDAFNVFNRANISGVRTTQYSRSSSASLCGMAGTPCLVPQNAGATAFGTPTATLDSRIMQFSAKIVF